MEREMLAATIVGQPYTAGTWVVQAGQEDEFIRRWTEFTGWAQREAPGGAPDRTAYLA